MAKNIVICLDGTGNEYGDRNSNVVKLFQALVYDQKTQVSYYHPGLGTIGAPNALTRLGQWWTRLLGLAFGYGLTSNICDPYGFLMNEYEAGDRVFLFGFSRGAYVARALAAMLHMFGLLRRGNDALVPYAARMLRRHDHQVFGLAQGFKKTFAEECKPHFVGVWDTVSSVGWIYDPVRLPYTANNPEIAIGRHAISIDERRSFFRQNLWGPPSAGQDLRQVWFAGVHSDVGGGYAEADSGLAKIPLEWMLREARSAGLLVDDAEIALLLGRSGGGGYSSPDPTAMIHNSLRGFWRVLEYWPKRYTDLSVQPARTRWEVPRGEPRFITDGSMIHSSVAERTRRVGEYKPPNLPRAYSTEA